MAVNCAAIVETLLEAELFGIEDRTATGVRGRRGKFEHAHDGTLFLDEVSDLSPAAQAKLLRAIQDLTIERVGGFGGKRIDTRVIVATNQPLAELVALGRFRTDLFYRLNGIDVPVPPLRHRRDDIIELAVYFLDRYRMVRPFRLSQAASDALVAYDWPGNVRELERVIERAVALAGSDLLELDDLPPAVVAGYGEALLPSLRARDGMRAWASRYARLVLERCGGNKRRACRELGISYTRCRRILRYRVAVRGTVRIVLKGLPGASGVCGWRGRVAIRRRGRVASRSDPSNEGLHRRTLWFGIESLGSRVSGWRRSSRSSTCHHSPLPRRSTKPISSIISVPRRRKCNGRVWTVVRRAAR